MVAISVVLMGGKFLAFVLTDSVGILTDAMESIVNVVAGFISLYSLYLAAKPKDKEHPFGHGKVELISASIEGLMILVAGGIIIFEGVNRLFSPSMPQKLDIGIIVVAFAGLVNWVAGWYSIRTGKRHNSIALVSSGKHLQSDTYSTIGLVIGLVLLYVTKVPWIDSALALVFGAVIALTGIGILRKTTANLMDSADRSVLEAVGKVIDSNRQPDWIDIHDMKVIKYGSFFYIDCDMTVPWYYDIVQGNAVSKALSEAVEREFSDRVQLSVHLDSCAELHCEHCEVAECPYRRKPFEAPLEYTLGMLTQTNEVRWAEGEEKK